jgi:hypothetical protein
MKKILATTAYIWAIACFIVLLAAFIKTNTYAGEMAKLPFIKLHPVYSGGDQAKTISEPGLETTIYKPVFDRVIGQSKTGFVQVKFTSPTDTLPPVIKKDIDYNFDNAVDFGVEINTSTGETKIHQINRLVKDINVSSRVKKSWVIRVDVLNPAKNK